MLGRGLVTVEYLYDESGWSAAQFDSAAGLALAPGAQNSAILDRDTAEAYRAGMLRRNHAHLAYHHSWRQKWRFAVRELVCADDGSGYTQPSVTWAPTDHAEMGVELFINHGAGRTGFGLFPVRTNITVRLKYFL